jgi:hypothetical protein
MPEPGEDHLHRCPVCGGTGYVTARFGRRGDDEFREFREKAEDPIRA